jgi:multidrug efflux pump subunit AcrA (membrane-fusion protein)
LAIEHGQTAELLVPELPKRVFPATVGRTAGAISADSPTLLVELDVDHSGGEILAGSFAQVRFAGTCPTFSSAALSPEQVKCRGKVCR